MINKSSRVLLGAIDQSTTATKFTLFDQQGQQIAQAIKEHQQISEAPGYLSHDTNEILNNVDQVIQQVVEQLQQLDIHPSSIKSVGITNQRESVVAFNKKTNEVYGNSIVWCDQRTKSICDNLIKKYGDKNFFKKVTGLPISTYFSAFKIQWLLDNHPHLQDKLQDVAFGTMDSIVLKHLTGNFSTDVTNASRTFLMNINTLEYDENLLQLFRLNKDNLAPIHDSCYDYGIINRGALGEYKIPIQAILGDQHSACLGHGNISIGMTKHTYGTGCFMQTNTGNTPVHTDQGLLTTVLFKLGEHQTVQYALEGAIETGAQNINWLKNNLQLFKDFEEMNALLTSSKNNKNVYFVPAFSGLYSPYWNESATGMLIGMTHHSGRAQLVRSTIEAICYRTYDVVDTMQNVLGNSLSTLAVDGGITVNPHIMQLQADILQKPISKTRVTDSTSLGVAFAAGLQAAVYHSVQDITTLVQPEHVYLPDKQAASRVSQEILLWKKAVQKAMYWP